MITLIASMGKNREIGYQNKLVFQLKTDMRFFYSATVGHTVVMGSSTWQSLPHKLVDRLNLVVSSSQVEKADGTITDFTSFLKYHQDSSDNIYIIGGGSVYQQALPYASMMYLTEINASATADTYFPSFTASEWNSLTLKTGTEDGYSYTIKQYTKKPVTTVATMNLTAIARRTDTTKDLDLKMKAGSTNVSSGTNTSFNGGTIVHSGDITTGVLAPEAITCENVPVSSTYYIYVYNYTDRDSGENAFSGIGATVEIMKNGAVYIASGSKATGSGAYWNVAKVSNGNITIKNTVTAVADTSY